MLHGTGMCVPVKQGVLCLELVFAMHSILDAHSFKLNWFAISFQHIYRIYLFKREKLRGSKNHFILTKHDERKIQ